MKPAERLRWRQVWQLSTRPRQSSSSGRGGRPKTHRGVRTQFGALARAEASIDIALRQFLIEGYDLKTVADYEICFTV